MTLNERWAALVAAGRAEWRAGMRTQRGNRILGLARAGWVLSGVPHYEKRRGAVPDWSDGPTRGALLDQVRERWGDPRAVPRWKRDRWWFGGVAMCHIWGATEAETLIAALEAAPEAK